MTLLRCRVPIEPDEALVGYASRLAACNDVGLSEFCRDMDVSLREVVRGGADAVARLADLAGEAPSRLADGAIRYVTHFVHEVRGETLHKRWLRRRSLTVCPRCVARDVASGRVLAGEAAYDRLRWHVKGVETCVEHAVSLLRLDADLPHDLAYDFSSRLAPHLDDLSRLVDEAPERTPSAFEAYLCDRIDGRPRDDCALDAMPFHVAQAACLNLGALTTSGPGRTVRSLRPDERREAEAVGFEALRRGRAGLWDLLEGDRSRIVAGRESREGPQAVFGMLWHWLCRVHGDDAYASLIGDVVDFVSDSFPLPAGHQVLGRTLERRRWHSLSSAAAETGLPLIRVRRLLEQGGLLPDDHEGRCDGLVLVDAEAASAALAPAGRLLESVEVMARLNVRRKAFDNLVDEGLLGLDPRTSVNRSRRWQFDPRVVTLFEERLFDHAIRIRELGPGCLDVVSCAAASRFSLPRVVRLALEDRDLWRGRLDGMAGLPGLVLRLDEVEARLARPDGVRDAKDLACALRVSTTTAAALLDAGTIGSRWSTRHVYGRSVRVVKQADVDAFASEHASVLTLSEELGQSVSAVRHWLAVSGVEPALPVPTKGSAIYRRGDLPPDPPAGRAALALSAHELARRLGVDTASAAALLSDGVIPFRTVPGPVSGKPVRVVSEADLEAFETEFVTFKALAREHRVTPARLRMRLLAAGVAPASSRKGCQGVAYRRSDVPPEIGTDAVERRLLSVADAKRRIGVGEDVINALVDGGAVAAVKTHVAVGGRQVRVVSAADVDRLASLDSLARETTRPAALLRSLLEAMGVEPVFRGGARGEVVYRRSDMPDAGSWTVATSEGITLEAVAGELGMSEEQVRRLLDVGLISSQPLQTRRKWRPSRVVLRSDLAAFKADYVTLSEVARTRRCPPSTARKRLAEAGVRPVRDTRRNAFTLYRRSEVVGCEATRTERASDPTASTRGRRSRSSDSRGRP